jgi:RNA polymerase sigma-70 factor (ECF subfamily)
MERAGLGDDDAFTTLVDRYYEHVVYVIHHLMGNKYQAHDLAQEVFLRIYRARRSYRAKSKFSTWLFVIVNNVVRNARRSLARRREVLMGIPTFADDRNTDRPFDIHRAARQDGLRDHLRVEPADALLQDELCERVRAAVEDLNARQRTAILLYHFAGLSYAEVADEMETTLCAAKALLHRARHSLRDQLQSYANA